MQLPHRRQRHIFSSLTTGSEKGFIEQISLKELCCSSPSFHQLHPKTMRLLISIAVLFFVTILTVSAPVLAPSAGEANLEAYLARRFPQVQPDERRYIGNIPVNLVVSLFSSFQQHFSLLHRLLTQYQVLQGLIRGADRKGRLTLPAPEPGHVMLLTRPASFNPKNPKVHGVGILTTSRQVHYFRTITFQPHEMLRDPANKAPVIDSTKYIPARSRNEKLFPKRTIKIDFGDGSYFKPNGEFALSHLSVLPVNRAMDEYVTVYHPDLVEYVQKGPQAGSNAIINWSTTPNWSKADQRRASLQKWSKNVYNLFRSKGSKHGGLPDSSGGEGSSGRGGMGAV